MKCRDCEFISGPTTFREDKYPIVRCTLGLWDKKEDVEQWYSFGESQLNRGPVRRFGEACTQGRPKEVSDLTTEVEDKKPEDCKKSGDCQKVVILQDKDMLPGQRRRWALAICAKCDEFDK